MGGTMGTQGDLTCSAEHTIRYTDDVFYNCTPESWIILLAYVTPKKFNKK